MTSIFCQIKIDSSSSSSDDTISYDVIASPDLVSSSIIDYIPASDGAILEVQIFNSNKLSSTGSNKLSTLTHEWVVENNYYRNLLIMHRESKSMHTDDYLRNGKIYILPKKELNNLKNNINNQLLLNNLIKRSN